MISGIHIVPDYPAPGIRFYDITTLLKNADHFNQICHTLKNHYRDIPVALHFA